MSDNLDIKTSKLPTKKTGIIVAYVTGDDGLEGQGAQLWQKTGKDWKKTTKAADFEGKKGQVLSLLAPDNLPCDRFLILGAGPRPQEEETPAQLIDWASRGGALMAHLEALRCEKAAIILDHQGLEPEQIAEFAAGLRLRRYKFDKYKSPQNEAQKSPAQKSPAQKSPAPKKLALNLFVQNKPAADRAIAKRMARVQGTLLARDLVNEPANVLGPREFADIALALKEHGVEVEVLTAPQMKKLGMGSLLSVAEGSQKPALMAVMQWKGGKKTDQPVAFVGKGVCFDTGGISIKPAGSMQDMKGDMGGAAAVTGLMKTLALRKAPLNVVGVIGLVENMPDGKSTRPGDIVTAMSGTTIEIINTDAEGRLVLADALWYTQGRFKPKFMINLATLTGAILVALGQEHAGLFSNDDDLAAKLYDAGVKSGEKLWRLPLAPAYDKLIHSRFADIKNTGGRMAGSITAAQFLQRFVNDVPWAHLDIAATGFSAPATEINRSWASGFGVALLDQLVQDHYES